MKQTLPSKKTNLKKLNSAEKQRVTISNLAMMPTVIKNYIDALIRVYHPKFKYKLKIEFFYYIITTIIKSQNTYKNKELENVPVPLNATILKGIRSDYNEYINWLIEQEVIFKAENYEVGVSSNKYRFADFILPTIYDNISSIVVEMKGLESDNVIVANSLSNLPIYKANEHLLKWFDNKITVDFEKANKYIEDTVFWESECFDFKHSKFHWIQQVSALNNKVYHATRNEQSDYRLHTILTNLKKNIKPFIKYDGKNLVCYDLKNSQPFFFIYLIDSIINKNKNINPILHRVYNDKYIFMLQNINEILCQKGFQEEYVIFKRWVLDGKIYEEMEGVIRPTKCLGSYFVNKYNKSKNITARKKVDSVRVMMKGIIFTLFFSGVNTRNPDYKTFKNAFPNLVAVIELFKENNNADFSKVLQNIEADCIIDFVSKKIAVEHPEMPLFSIHDSLSTTEDFGEILKTLMPLYVLEYTGLLPIVDEERWKKSDCQVDYKKRVELHPEWYAFNRF